MFSFARNTLLILVLIMAVPAPAGLSRAACGGDPWECNRGQAYGDAYLITDLRDQMSDAPDEDPPDCSKDDVNLYQDIASYNTRDLDIYYPADAATGRTVLVFVHGGAWETMYKDHYTWVPTVFTGGLGWVTVVVNYRLVSDTTFRAATCPTREGCQASPPDPWEKESGSYTLDSKAAWYPDNLDDVAEAFAWVVANIGQAPYQGNIQKIYLMGHSAGAHLVTLMALHPGYRDRLIGPAHLYQPLKRHIAGIISLSGGYDLTTLPPAVYSGKMDQLFQGCGHTANLEPPCSQAVLEEASPRHYLAADTYLPPLLMMRAASEIPGFLDQSEDFVQALNDLGLPHTYEVLDSFSHVTEMMSIRYTGGDEPTQAALGDYQDTPTPCMQDFGPNPKPAGYLNPTDKIVAWIMAHERSDHLSALSVLLSPSP